MSDLNVITEEIDLLERSEIELLTCEQANDIIEKLGGSLRYKYKDDPAHACYYITLLSLRNLHLSLGDVS